jgi:hypothetical protein
MPSKNKKAKKAAKRSAPPKKHRIPRQEVLPGVGDAKIQAIENAAYDYAELRDQRQELTRQEVDLKKKLIDLMHKKELTEYKRNGITVKLVVEEESVKVRVKDSEDDLPTEITPAPSAQVNVESMAVNSEAS